MGVADMRWFLLAVSAAAPLWIIALSGLRAAETATLTLSCDGTIKNMLSSEDKPETITKMGFLINLPDQTVMGFAHPARVKKVDAVSVGFGGKAGNWYVEGTIDRITGSIAATEQMIDAAGKMFFGHSWDLNCTPTKRAF
jgi:hypothetical protein